MKIQYSLKKLLLTGCVCSALFMPFRTQICPTWRIRLTNVPVGVKFSVRQTWQNYSIELDGHSESLDFNLDNEVTLPPRYARGSLLWRIAYPTFKAIANPLHSSFGPSTWVFISNSGGGPSIDLFPSSTEVQEISTGLFCEIDATEALRRTNTDPNLIVLIIGERRFKITEKIPERFLNVCSVPRRFGQVTRLI